MDILTDQEFEEHIEEMNASIKRSESHIEQTEHRIEKIRLEIFETSGGGAYFVSRGII